MLTAFVAFALFGFLTAFEQAPQGPPRTATAAAVTVDGPFTHDNLSIYILRGVTDDGRAYLTLDQGLAARTVDVRERGAAAGQDQSTVNSIEIQNKSDKWLFLHSGDIIKGGKQDRTIMTDVLLPPHSQPQMIDAFCVEHGRWTPSRDGLAFKANPGIVSGNALKRAIQSEKNQSRVWQEVALAEGRAGRVAAAAGSAALGTPLSTTGTYNAIAENKTVNGGRGSYVTALTPSLRKHSDAIGMAVAINGKMIAADTYSSPALFSALSGKLLDSYALEAVLARQAAAPSPAPATQHVSAFLSNAAAGPAAAETVGQSMHRSTRETRDSVMYEYGTVTAARGRREVTVLHKSYLVK